MEYKVDITIVGAGIIGLAIVAQVARNKREVCVLEKNESFGQETSSRSSKVVHSGIYYPPDSIKAKMCIKGKKMLYELCERERILYKRASRHFFLHNKSFNKLCWP